MRDVSIVGVGMTPFAHRPESFMDIAADGVIDALYDKDLRNLEMKDVEASYFGTMGGGPQAGQKALARLRSRMEEKGIEPQEGLTGIPVSNYENQCTSGTCAFDAAYRDISAGIHDIILAFGAIIAMNASPFSCQLSAVYVQPANHAPKYISTCSIVL